MLGFMDSAKILGGLVVGALTIGLAGPKVEASLMNNLELYYNFDTATTDVGGVPDLSGNSRAGTIRAELTGTATLSSDVPSGFEGQSVEVKRGIGTYAGGWVETPYDGIFGNAARTVALWVKPTAVGLAGATQNTLVEWGAPVGTPSSNGLRWTVRIDDGGAFRVEVQGGFKMTTAKLVADTWQHVAVTFDGTGIHDAQLYIDGVLQTSTSQSSTNQAINTATGHQPVRIGRTFDVNRSGGSDRYFDGHIDDVGIWSRALTAQEVAVLATSPIPEPALFSPLVLGGLLMLLKGRSVRRTKQV